MSVSVWSIGIPPPSLSGCYRDVGSPVFTQKRYFPAMMEESKLTSFQRRCLMECLERECHPVSLLW